jgi:hypothetical protein
VCVCVCNLKYYPSIFLVLRKTTKNFGQNNQSPGRDLNLRPANRNQSALHSPSTFGGVSKRISLNVYNIKREAGGGGRGIYYATT